MLLDYLNLKKIAIDLSHTSDALAHDILNYIHKKNLSITPIASHSNYRTIQDIPRNLPNEIAQEIIEQGGAIGLNLIRRFVGESPKDLFKHIHHALELGAEDCICLGTDFYGGIHVPTEVIPERTFPTFYKELGNASCYPHLISLLKEEFSEELVKKICYQNAQNFLVRQKLINSLEKQDSINSMHLQL